MVLGRIKERIIKSLVRKRQRQVTDIPPTSDDVAMEIYEKEDGDSGSQAPNGDSGSQAPKAIDINLGDIGDEANVVASPTTATDVPKVTQHSHVVEDSDGDSKET